MGIDLFFMLPVPVRPAESLSGYSLSRAKSRYNQCEKRSRQV